MQFIFLFYCISQPIRKPWLFIIVFKVNSYFDWKYPNYTFAKSKYPVTEKLTNGALVIPIPGKNTSHNIKVHDSEWSCWNIILFLHENNYS